MMKRCEKGWEKNKLCTFAYAVTMVHDYLCYNEHTKLALDETMDVHSLYYVFYLSCYIFR